MMRSKFLFQTIFITCQNAFSKIVSFARIHIQTLLRHNLCNSQFLYGMRIFIALSGSTLIPWLINQINLTIPLTLGVVAAALTDLDNRFAGRLRTILLTLSCFFIASVSIELLMPFPILFTFGLSILTFSLIMLGCLGQRYATVAFGTLLISIYTMIGSGLYHPWYIQPLLLIAGAIWYYFITLLGHLLFPIKPIQDQIALCYKQLASYLDAKAMLFDPDEEGDFNKQLITLAMVNRNLIDQLNQTKSSLLTRIRDNHEQDNVRHCLFYYFIVQDIHEQTSSIHIKYQILSKTFRYSDILFRFQRLLKLQANACRKIARSINYNEPYHHDSQFNKLFLHLQHTLSTKQVKATATPYLLNSLNYLLNNLQQLDQKFTAIESEQFTITTEKNDEKLSEDNYTNDLPFWEFIKQQFTLQSSLFRHAVRMTIVFMIGYGIIQFAQLKYGYWILLTSLFVCQPNYCTTQRRLFLRIIGTFSGVIIGLPLLYLIPTQEGQLILITLSGWLFFIFRNNNYAYATSFITLLVLVCFSLLGEHSNIALPRIIDTIIGCSIVWLAVSYIWPEWQFRRLPDVTTRALNNNLAYLNAITIQYQYGKNNHVDYRSARRNAHNSDAELASLVSFMSSEPKKKQILIATSFKWLYLNQLLLGYISALGSHRQQLHDNEIINALSEIQIIIQQLTTQHTFNNYKFSLGIHLEQKIVHKRWKNGSVELFIAQHLISILNLLPELMKLNKILQAL